MQKNEILQGDALQVLTTLPSESVQCCLTSPPYWPRLRNYLPDDHPDKQREIGQESTLDAYIAHLVQVFREVKRILRPDGVLWLNMGDCFAGSGRGVGGKQAYLGTQLPRNAFPLEVPKRNLLGMPWRVAFALQADGWWLRSDCVWFKPNCLPESVKNRPTRAHEYVFLLSKSEHYFYDYVAVMEPASAASLTRILQKTFWQQTGGPKDYRSGINPNRSMRQVLEHVAQHPQRNLRSVFQINTQPFKGHHYAVMPTQLAKLCILAGSSPYACEHCGAPWKRIVQHARFERHLGSSKYIDPAMQATGIQSLRAAYRAQGLESPPPPQTLGWQPTCTCEEHTSKGKCLILDPFAGAGTTLLTAAQVGRDWLGIELSAEYVEMARKRIG